MKMDSEGLPTGLNKRAFRVARGSGTSVKEVEEMLTQARAMSGFAKMAGGMANASKEKDWYVCIIMSLHSPIDRLSPLSPLTGQRPLNTCRILGRDHRWTKLGLSRLVQISFSHCNYYWRLTDFR